MSQCSTFATATSTGVRTEQDVVTTSSASVIIESPTTSTIVSSTTSCADAQGSASAAAPQCETIPVTTTTVIPGSTRTDQVPVTITNDKIVSEPTTLFGTSCSNTNNNDNTSKNNNGGQTNNGNNQTGDSGSTPSPTVITTQSQITDAAGNVSLTSILLTTTPPPSTATGADGSNGTVGSSPAHSTTNVGAIVGGVIGGVFGLLALLVAVWFLLKRRRRWDALFDNDYADFMGRKKNRMDLDGDYEDTPAAQEPKPYHYGLVGGPIPSPSGHTTDTRASSALSHNRTPSSLSHARPPSGLSHNRTESLTPSIIRGRHPSIDGHSPNPSISQPPLVPVAGDAYFPNIPATRVPTRVPTLDAPPPQRVRTAPSPQPPSVANAAVARSRTAPSPQPPQQPTYPPKQSFLAYDAPEADPFAVSPPTTQLPPGAAPPAVQLRGPSPPTSPPIPPASPPVKISAPPPYDIAKLGHTPKRGSTATANSSRSSVSDYPMRQGGVLRVANGDIPKSPMTPDIPTSGAKNTRTSVYKSPLSLDLGDSTFDSDGFFGSLDKGKRTSRQT